MSDYDSGLIDRIEAIIDGVQSDCDPAAYGKTFRVLDLLSAEGRLCTPTLGFDGKPLPADVIAAERVATARAEQEVAESELKRIRHGYATMAHEVDQILGKALGYPVYGPDMFPDGEPNGDVCTGDHVPESLAAEAADMIRDLAQKLANARVDRDSDWRTS